MRIFKSIVFISLLFIIYSCSKNIEPRILDFEIKVLNTSNQETINFKVGDTVNFKFFGNPDHIVFFSGEKGRRFKYYDKVSDTSNNVVLKFSSTLTQKNNGNLMLLISTAYPGYTQFNTQDSLSILSSYPNSWTDISNRANWSTGNGAQISNVNLSDFAALNKPVFLAFRYSAAAALPQSSWTINTLGLRHYTTDSTFCLDSTSQIIPTGFPAWVKSPGWGVVSISNPLIKFTLNSYSGTINGFVSPASNASTSSFIINGNATGSSALSTETWVVSGPINLHDVLPDAGISIKDMTTDASKSFYSTLTTKANYAYVFKKPGTYEVSFLATTSSKDSKNNIVKTITITVN